jgi:hypothetical protein
MDAGHAEARTRFKSTIYSAIKAGRLRAHKLYSVKYAIYPGELRRGDQHGAATINTQDGRTMSLGARVSLLLVPSRHRDGPGSGVKPLTREA